MSRANKLKGNNKMKYAINFAVWSLNFAILAGMIVIGLQYDPAAAYTTVDPAAINLAILEAME
jgi:hypothetical protein